MLAEVNNILFLGLKTATDGADNHRSRWEFALFSRHPVLSQLAKDIASGIADPRVLSLPIDIYVGIHSFKWFRVRPGRYSIGLQAEHYFDVTGRIVQPGPKRSKVLSSALVFNRILDLSVGNQPVYDWLPAKLKSKIDFGPHIFPKHDISFDVHNSPDLAFFGALNDRRAKVIASSSSPVRQASNQIYGKDLTNFIKSCRAVLNVHYLDGIYTEYPRLLTAYLEGKVIVSDQLELLRAKQHYIPVEDISDPKFDGNIFDQFKREIAQTHTFEDYLLSQRPDKK
ncbi:MAG: hypothetical protein ACPG5U_03320 [Planktomarina sp.]